jgi:microcystin-dependent protein
MSEFYMGQVMLVGFGFAPKYWAQCNGQVMSIQQNAALFSLLGTTYGGNGVQTFGLPDLRGRTPVGAGSSVDSSWQPNMQQGQIGGVENVTLNTTQVPAHAHQVNASTAVGNNRLPSARVFAQSTNTAGAALPLYAPAGGSTVQMNPATVAQSGQNQPHNNMQPYTALNFCIALSGIYPSRS